MKHLFTLLLTSIFLLCPSASAETLTGKVTAIADGDTITTVADNIQHKIRLA